MVVYSENKECLHFHYELSSATRQLAIFIVIFIYFFLDNENEKAKVLRFKTLLLLKGFNGPYPETQ